MKISENIQIRPAVEADIPLLESLLERSVRELTAGYYTPAQIESGLKHAYHIDRQLIGDGSYLVAELPDPETGALRIVGCGGWSRRKMLHGGDRTNEGDDSILDPAVDAARIRAFFIDPAFARRGIGRRLIEACEAAGQAAGFRRFVLGATLSGEPMYAALGYVALEREEHPLADGETLPLILMEKRIA